MLFIFQSDQFHDTEKLNLQRNINSFAIFWLDFETVSSCNITLKEVMMVKDTISEGMEDKVINELLV